MKSHINKIKAYCHDPRNSTIVDVGLFIILIISFHYLFIGWQNLNYWPIGKQIIALQTWATRLLFNQSVYVLDHVFNVDITTLLERQIIYSLDHNGDFVSVTVLPECASLKQWLHWIFLMLLFPGPWKHKAWFIPTGLVIIEWINVIRVVGLLLVQIPCPGSFHFAHDYVFKTMFYFIIFLMWVIWVECFDHPRKKKEKIDK
jgi:Transmembrane exosortase (Exosortase_EpsH).